ncbi:hypothetical protein BBK82_20610 [Lentzea guizhouensis]|uniref:TIR domain-containing protein n=1 Tax=Lentzea guizhouensis TaxID=1586287 RepID=A0A1B2HK46_9PSEU|nr:toll/interleukin-1 receptor domain-containing protein [Lentzea guizhouensis]ANZ38106.1 hypothetical protein BBK82_20610 [Lentzea guizhouensis]
MTASFDSPPIRCFLSYARQDDVVMDFVAPFAASLRQYAYSDRGRSLDVFLDREAIGWGDLVQPVLRSAVRGATVFLPVVTRRYFDRPYCREELFLFYNQASVAGVRTLLLPVVLLGDSFLTEDNPDLAVRLIVERQFRSVREAWLEGPSSPTWRRTMLSLAGALVDAVEEAELALAAPPPVLDADISAELDRFSLDVRTVIAETRSVITEFQSLVGGDPSLLLPGAHRLREAGWTFERRAFELDRLLRATGRSFPAAPTAELLALLPGIEALLTSTRRAEATNAPVRRTMTVFREGLTALRSGLCMVKSWSELPNPGQ